jgi:hypothetical protein
MKWPAEKHLTFYFSLSVRYTIFIFVWFQGFNKLDSESTTTAMGGGKKYPYKWVEENNFISPQSFVCVRKHSTIVHKYTKNVCMTGHNIKYHQNKMEELDGRVSVSPYILPPFSTIFYVCGCSHISTFVRGIFRREEGKIRWN